MTFETANIKVNSLFWVNIGNESVKVESEEIDNFLNKQTDKFNAQVVKNQKVRITEVILFAITILTLLILTIAKFKISNVFWLVLILIQALAFIVLEETNRKSLLKLNETYGKITDIKIAYNFFNNLKEKADQIEDVLVRDNKMIVNFKDEKPVIMPEVVANQVDFNIEKTFSTRLFNVTYLENEDYLKTTPKMAGFSILKDIHPKTSWNK